MKSSCAFIFQHIVRYLGSVLPRTGRKVASYFCKSFETLPACAASLIIVCSQSYTFGFRKYGPFCCSAFGFVKFCTEEYFCYSRHSNDDTPDRSPQSTPACLSVQICASFSVPQMQLPGPSHFPFPSVSDWVSFPMFHSRILLPLCALRRHLLPSGVLFQRKKGIFSITYSYCLQS